MVGVGVVVGVDGGLAEGDSPGVLVIEGVGV